MVPNCPLQSHLGRGDVPVPITATAIGSFARPCVRGLTKYVVSFHVLALFFFSNVDNSKHLIPHAEEWEEAASLPDALYQQAADDGLLMPMAAGSNIPVDWRGKFPIIGNINPEEWDGFHDFIIHDEFGRVGGVGYDGFWPKENLAL